VWWAGSERLTIYLGASIVGVQRDGAANAEWQDVDATVSGFEQAIQASSRHSGSKRRRLTIDLQLSGGLARPFVLDAVRGLKNFREATELAASIAPDSTGLTGPCVVWLDDWMPGQPCIAVAMDKSLRDQLEATAAAGGVKLGAVRPWWSLAIDAAKSKFAEPLRLLAIEDTDSLTLLDSANAAQVSTSTHTPRLDPAPLRATLARAALAANLQPGDAVFAAMPRDEERHRHGLAPVVERWA
jgi:hypothetical protein